MPTPRVFADLHAQARRLARRPEEADDLLQSALLAALESGRTDLASPETRRWLSGVIRNRAAFDARTSARRRRRDSAWGEDVFPRTERGGGGSPRLRSETVGPAATLPNLSPSLRLTALRQRISQLKRALDNAPAPDAAPTGPLAFGRIRRALLGPARRENAFLASHDPDGHPFVVSGSHFHAPRQQRAG